MTAPRMATYLFQRGRSRLFEPLLNFLTLYDCIAVAALYGAYGRAPGRLGDFGTAYPNQFPGLQVKHLSRGLSEAALAGNSIDGFPVNVEAREPAVVGLQTSGFQGLILNAISPTFVAYFETQRQWLDSNVSTDTQQWPSLWQFGRVVRNAASHGGTINWLNPNAKPVTWHRLTYNAADRGKPIIGGDLTLGDLLVLILEMDTELDRLGCPH